MLPKLPKLCPNCGAEGRLVEEKYRFCPDCKSLWQVREVCPPGYVDGFEYLAAWIWTDRGDSVCSECQSKIAGYYCFVHRKWDELQKLGRFCELCCRKIGLVKQPFDFYTKEKRRMPESDWRKFHEYYEARLRINRELRKREQSQDTPREDGDEVGGSGS